MDEDDHFDIDESIQRKPPPESIKRGLRACHLFGIIWKRHFDAELCELMTERSFDWRSYSLNILDNVLLLGSFPRDILLGIDIENESIDVVLNLRELGKIQLNHIRKYHSVAENRKNDIQCAYWQHYMRKFEHFATQNSDNEMIRFHENPYIFNSKYFVNVLQSSPELHNKLTVENYPERGLFTLCISGDIEHENINLNGAKFTFTDTFGTEKVLSLRQQSEYCVFGYIRNNFDERYLIEGIHVMNVIVYFYQSMRLNDDKKKHAVGMGRLKSISLFPNPSADPFEAYMEQRSDVYSTRINDVLSTSDFSINTTLIPMSSITEFCDSEDEVNIAIWFWEYIIENGIDTCDGIKDITVHKILRLPTESPKYLGRIINLTHFWKCIRLMLHLPNSFFVDDALINAHIAHYDAWLNIDYFSNETHRIEFVHRFGNILEKYCKSMDKLRRLLSAFESFQFNARFIKILSEFDELKAAFVDAITQKCDSPNALNVFKSYEYPFDDVPYVRIRTLERRNKALESENEALKQEILKLQTMLNSVVE